MQHPAFKVTTAASVLAVSMLLAACGGDGSSSAEPAPGAGQNPQATVNGTVFDAATGAPVAAATVRSGTQTTTTGADGKFTLQLPPNARAPLTISKASYADNVVIAPASTATASSVSAQLLPVAATGEVEAAAGGTVTVPNSPAQVALTAGSLARADGLPIAGKVTVAVTPIDPASNTAAMPGDFRARTATGLATIESYGAMTVTMTDTTGAKVNLATGKAATIRIPLASRGTPTPTIPLFWFNADTGEWVEEGQAALSGTAPNQYYEGTVTHFTTWNADQYYNTVNVTGCLKTEDGAPVADARVTSDGIDYSGNAWGLTDAAGNFTVAMKREARATLTAQSGVQFSNSVGVQSPTADFAGLPAGQCLVLSGAATGLTIKLTWGAQPDDVDSHLFTPNGDVVFYGSEGSLAEAPFAALDVDDTDSFGPEIVTVRRLMVGTYRYAVHNFSRTNDPGLTGSPVRVELNNAGSVAVFTPPAGESAETEWWTVFSLTVDAQCRVTVTPVNTWSAQDPAPLPAGNPTYCTAP